MAGSCCEAMKDFPALKTLQETGHLSWFGLR